ncbi:MAG TPA: hypothetical protein VFQ45_04255 [Longimicrobium sp.]|nr:hypothetical protein [Longimicrobium sp.]
MPRLRLLPLALLAILAACESSGGDEPPAARTGDPDSATAAAMNRTEGSFSARRGSPLAEFYLWWDRANDGRGAPGEAPEPPPAGVQAGHRPFLEMPRIPAGSAPRPADAGSVEGEVLEVGRANGRRVVLWVPLKGSTPESERACANAAMQVGVEPFSAWLPLNLQPHCDEYYAAEEVDVTMYTVEGAAWPFIGIVTNGPACSPFTLLRYDDGAGRYEQYKGGCA